MSPRAREHTHTDTLMRVTRCGLVAVPRGGRREQDVVCGTLVCNLCVSGVCRACVGRVGGGGGRVSRGYPKRVLCAVVAGAVVWPVWLLHYRVGKLKRTAPGCLPVYHISDQLDNHNLLVPMPRSRSGHDSPHVRPGSASPHAHECRVSSHVPCAVTGAHLRLTLPRLHAMHQVRCR